MSKTALVQGSDSIIDTITKHLEVSVIRCWDISNIYEFCSFMIKWCEDEQGYPEEDALQTEMIPSYDMGTLRIPEFHRMRKGRVALTSDPLYASGLGWRLRTYCAGTAFAVPDCDILLIRCLAYRKGQTI